MRRRNLAVCMVLGLSFGGCGGSRTAYWPRIAMRPPTEIAVAQPADPLVLPRSGASAVPPSVPPALPTPSLREPHLAPPASTDIPGLPPVELSNPGEVDSLQPSSHVDEVEAEKEGPPKLFRLRAVPKLLPISRSWQSDRRERADGSAPAAGEQGAKRRRFLPQ